MNRRVVFLSAFAAVLMMSLATYAQDRPKGGPGGPGGRMGMRMGSGWLLRAEAVQKELGVTEEQLKKLQEVLEAGRPQGGNQPDFANMTDEERQKFREEMQKRFAEQEKKVNEILDEKQQARLKQIGYQAGVARGNVGEELMKSLALTEEQQGKVKALQDEINDAPQGEQAALREAFGGKLVELLTDDHKAKYKELLGEPFDVSQIRMRGPGGGRRGGN